MLFLKFALIIYVTLLPIATCIKFSTIQRIMGQSISSTQFFIYGKRNFTQTGYENHIKKYVDLVQKSASIGRNVPGSDGVDMTGKVVVITGANSGIGKELAIYAATKGAKLYMLCRSKERAEKARDEIIKLTSNDQVEIVLADLAEMAQVRKAAESLSSKESKIDVLVCNGGVLLNDREESSEGYEMTFASHLLGGSYLLSTLLIPKFKASEDKGRVIFVSSGGMYNSKFPDWETATSSTKDETHKYDGNFAYAYAKRGQVLLAEYYTKTIPEISWTSAHPGWSLTDAVDAAYGESKKYLEPFRTPWQGAEGMAWMMSTPKENLQSGAFYLDRKPQRKHLSGAFFTEGSFTKNTEQEVDEMVSKLKEATGL
jgi:dehydrogenase/reductase SDR family member 12